MTVASPDPNISAPSVPAGEITSQETNTVADPPAAEVAEPSTPEPVRTDPVPRTRMSAAWVGICVATLALVMLIVFMLQNTRRVEVSFLWMQGSVPLALALLIAGVGAAIVTGVIGAARITQLRRRVTRRQPVLPD
ncbi:lipopolysaccharide assembly protein LapA domain-containing protein [Kribbella sp. NBC_00709]|uniref:LapA family protein n=1 Tax=Kribbella sp. NBC_00709 TaxID=2975972 RepID=UPI002E28C813|nr:lipopolysaccharide assembly protein LapA domain-containing protein [Kribbella sp. NBC_00709]